MQDVTEEYLSTHHEGYFEQFNKEMWTITYEKQYYKNVSFGQICIIIYQILKLINK
jgi:hypothetical protein